jgi:hypothetical protein
MKSPDGQIETLRRRHDALIASVRDVLRSAVGANSIQAVRGSYLFGANNPLGGTPVDVESLRIGWTDRHGDKRKVEFELMKLDDVASGQAYAVVKPVCFVGGRRADRPGIFWTDLTTKDHLWHFGTARGSKDSKPVDMDVIAKLATVKKPLPSPWGR